MEKQDGQSSMEQERKREKRKCEKRKQKADF